MRRWLVEPKTRAALAAVVLGGALLLSFLLDPDYEPGFTVCSFRNATGKPCLGCGLTHAFIWLSHGRVGDAIAANPLVLLVYPGFVAGFLWSLARLGGKAGPIPYPRIAEWWYGVLAVGLVAAWAARAMEWW
ncbi:MAG: DUF2752 domain-containing protein [Armatimonadetes bacterium]|nr:DUF2752 domain-containing protein [Armatimonadota bacterium]